MKKKIILIDASGLLFRAYFAMIKNPLYTKNGQPTSAVFGFLRMVFNLIKKFPCHSIAAAFDVPRNTLERRKSFEEYKATRKETPPDLIAQIPLAKECLDLAGIPAISVDGHEADDVLASLAKHYGQDAEIIIFTGDKDLLQLVQGNITIALPDKKSPDGSKILDREGVKELKGVYPEEIADFLAIIGDVSDNIPGVKGVGEKGAVKLIEEFHTLQNIYNNLNHITPSIAKKLEESHSNAFLSLDLIKLNCDLDVSLPKISDQLLTIADFTEPQFLSKLKELELFSLLKELSHAQTEGKESENSSQMLLFAQESSYEIQDFSLTTLDQLISSPFIGMQIINTVLEFSSEHDIFQLPLDSINEYKDMLRMFFQALEESEKQLIVFDQKKIIHCFEQFDLILPICNDLKLMAYLLDPARNNYQLQNLSLVYLGKNDHSAKIFLELFTILNNILTDQGMNLLYYNIEMPLRPLLARIESTGVRIDSRLMLEISSRLDEQLQILMDKIYLLAGKEFNILSPKQLGQILFEDLGLPPIKKTKTKSYSTDEESLAQLALIHPLPREILQYRSLSKFKNTYTDALPKLTDSKGRVHTTLHQTVTATGRLSSGEPNLQNIPIRNELGKEIRSAFIASEGRLLVSADYSQIELRLFAHLSHDQTMREFFLQGGDVHRKTASAMFGIPEADVSQDQRRAAKIVNYGISYGMSAFRLANELEVDFGKARDFIENYFETFPGVKRFMAETLEFACNNGFVKTLYARRRPVPELFGKKIDKLTNLSHPSRFAINAVVQGTAADIIKISMLNIQKLIQSSYLDSACMILQVHDELLFEVEESYVDQFIADVKNVMESVAVIDVPLEVDAGKGCNWAEAH